jgi:hypothetical protein
MKSEAHFSDMEPSVLTDLAKKAKVLNKAFPSKIAPVRN